MVRLRFLSLALGNPFLIKSPWICGLLWLAIVRDIRFPIFTIVGLAVADIVASALGAGEEVKREGALRGSAIFASLAVAWLTTASGATLQVQFVVEIAAATAASLVAAAFLRALRDSILPPLGWGFYIVAGVLFTLFASWTRTAALATIDWPYPNDTLGWVQSFFRSLGMLLFLPKVEVGVLVAVAILLWSRLMLLMGIIGWVSGVGIGLVLGHLGLTYLWLLAAHNYCLAAMLLGSTLFMPGRSMWLIAVAAGAAASIVSAYFQYLFPGSSFAFLPVPAALTVWLGVGALLLRDGSFQRNVASDVPPELAWWKSAYWTERFGQREPLFAVPLAEAVEITQGFDGDLSHVGRWRQALDFQRPTAIEGVPPESSIWEAPVYAPASGVVETARANVPDNPLGISNFAEMWGNHIIIRLDVGGWAMLAHLRQGSIVVSGGARIETGTYLAKVGNSGRSPTPHLHLHAQVSPASSASTMPFRLANFLTPSRRSSPAEFLRWNAACAPPAGSVIMAAQSNPPVHDAVASIAPGYTVWQVEVEGQIPRAFRRYEAGSVVRLRVFLDEGGRHLFRSSGGGVLVTSIDPDAWRVLEVRDMSCPLLKLLALGVPSIPYAATKGMNWLEPTPLPPSGFDAWFWLLVLPYLRQPFSYLSSTCTATPEERNRSVTIETKPLLPNRGMPTSVTCEVEKLRGPVRVEASFESGRLCFSMLSFEPGLPFERREKPRTGHR